MKRISILGSTGSIGSNTLKVISANPDAYSVAYLTAGRNAKRLIKQARQSRPRAVAIADETQYAKVKAALQSEGIRVYAGKQGILEIAGREDVDLVANAIVGAAGLEPTYVSLQAGKNIALSNKESLVMAGEIIMRLAEQNKCQLLPVDSEHSAIWQCLNGEPPDSVRRILLTGSGGPFRQTPLKEFATITPEMALQHPTWNMGKKITIDSATMMNKGLEIIEARWLFEVSAENIEVVIHPQSIIHSMVEFRDGSIKAQLGIPDMKLPIQYALYYPQRQPVQWEQTDFARIKALTFETPDVKKFPALRLAREALRSGGTAPAILNVMNEIAVYAFLNKTLKFTQISRLVEQALSHIKIVRQPELEDILNVPPLVAEFFERRAKQP